MQDFNHPLYETCDVGGGANAPENQVPRFWLVPEKRRRKQENENYKPAHKEHSTNDRSKKNNDNIYSTSVDDRNPA